jgi:hypothetical protein
MLYRICFAADVNDPMPDVATLLAVEADSPLAAVEQIVSSGRVPQDRLYRWARVVLSAENGHAKHVLRVPIEPVAEFPIYHLPG